MRTHKAGCVLAAVSLAVLGALFLVHLAANVLGNRLSGGRQAAQREVPHENA